VPPDASDQRRRAVGAPLAAVASGVTTSDVRCIALLDGLAALEKDWHKPLEDDYPQRHDNDERRNHQSYGGR
jgi:hypothetical protein